MLEGVAHQFGAAGGAGFDEQPTYVLLDVADRGFQPPGDLFIHHPLGHQLQHAGLPRREHMLGRAGWLLGTARGEQGANLGDLLGQLANVGIGKAGRLRQQPLLALDDIVDPSHQLVGIKGFGDVVVAAGLEAGDAISSHALGGEKDHRRAAQPLVGPQLLEQAVAIEARHHHVAEDDVGQHLLGHGPALLTVVGGGHRKALIFQIGLYRRAQAGLVVDQQQAHGRRFRFLGRGQIWVHGGHSAGIQSAWISLQALSGSVQARSARIPAGCRCSRAGGPGAPGQLDPCRLARGSRWPTTPGGRCSWRS